MRHMLDSHVDGTIIQFERWEPRDVQQYGDDGLVVLALVLIWPNLSGPGRRLSGAKVLLA